LTSKAYVHFVFTVVLSIVLKFGKGYHSESSGRDVSALDSQSEGHWFESHMGLEFHGFEIRSSTAL